MSLKSKRSRILLRNFKDMHLLLIGYQQTHVKIESLHAWEAFKGEEEGKTRRAKRDRDEGRERLQGRYYRD